MSEICFAWELGQNYGHVTRCKSLLERLQARGHSTHLALRDLSRLHHFFGGEAPPVHQAPLWLPRLVETTQPLSYADILLAVGYLDPTGLRALINAWIRLFEINHTELLIADHSPTAMLAARIMQLPCVTLGNGFCCPPRLSPLPPMCWWQEVEKDRLQSIEDRAVSTINEVLEAFGAQPMNSLSELFDVEDNFLCSFAELDHYPQRAILQTPKPVYLGPNMQLEAGELPAWPDVPGPMVFAYLYATWDGFQDMLKTFESLPISVLAHVPQLTAADEQAYSSANVRVTSTLQQMEAVRQQCEFAVCHGGIATVSAMLSAGRPLLLAPTQLEQTIVCRNVERLGAGLTLRTDTKRYPPKRLLNYLLEEPGFTRKAVEFADRYQDYSQDSSQDLIAARCDAILSGAGSD